MSRLKQPNQVVNDVFICGEVLACRSMDDKKSYKFEIMKINRPEKHGNIVFGSSLHWSWLLEAVWRPLKFKKSL